MRCFCRTGLYLGLLKPLIVFSFFYDEFVLLTSMITSAKKDYSFCNYKETDLPLLVNFLLSDSLTLLDYSKHWWRENQIMVKWKQKNLPTHTYGHIHIQNHITHIYTQTHYTYSHEHLEVKSVGSQIIMLAVNQSRQQQIRAIRAISVIGLLCIPKPSTSTIYQNDLEIQHCWVLEVQNQSQTNDNDK